MIDSFTGKYSFLSNFYIEPDGTHVEGEYQSMKTDPPTLDLRTLTPSQSKKQGRRLQLRVDWEDVKIQIMAALVAQKFHDHPRLSFMLLLTGRQELVEGNYWGDHFWGVCKGSGDNNLGKILMALRESIREKRRQDRRDDTR